jgi:hypothetical protein
VRNQRRKKCPRLQRQLSMLAPLEGAPAQEKKPSRPSSQTGALSSA